jgi:hypothetical protein
MDGLSRKRGDLSWKILPVMRIEEWKEGNTSGMSFLQQ